MCRSCKILRDPDPAPEVLTAAGARGRRADSEGAAGPVPWQTRGQDDAGLTWLSTGLASDLQCRVCLTCFSKRDPGIEVWPYSAGRPASLERAGDSAFVAC